jgi:AraC-like DNA-binding protein
MRSISKKGCSFPVARLICFDIINVTLHGLYAIADSESIRPAGDMLERLAGFDTIQELVVLLEEVIQTACQSIRQLRSAKTEDRASRIRQYVETNCFDPNFSIYSVAEDFDLTPSNLSHYFKAQTGQSISDYVQALRRTEACRLLTETKDPIQAIGEKVGMLNVSSFIRSFKQQTGMTPGQYRSLHAADKNGHEDL